MFGPPGIAYVYLVYGMHDCLNVVTEPDGRPAAVLIRAIEPTDGVDAIRRARLDWALRRHRVTPGSEAADRIRSRIDAIPTAELCRGPGLVSAGFGLGRADTGLDLLDPASPVRLEPAPAGDRTVDLVATPRIGIGYAAEPWRSLPWRLVDAASPSVVVGSR
jgi:DNA-3-methyladenine glycosylase